MDTVEWHKFINRRSYMHDTRTRIAHELCEVQNWIDKEKESHKVRICSERGEINMVYCYIVDAI